MYKRTDTTSLFAPVTLTPRGQARGGRPAARVRSPLWRVVNYRRKNVIRWTRVIYCENQTRLTGKLARQKAPLTRRKSPWESRFSSGRKGVSLSLSFLFSLNPSSFSISFSLSPGFILHSMFSLPLPYPLLCSAAPSEEDFKRDHTPRPAAAAATATTTTATENPSESDHVPPP